MILSRPRIHLACWLAFTVWGAQASSPPPYTMRIWRVDDGMPNDTVTSIAQTDDGYLWVGTPSGLARFDGVRFTVFNDRNTPELRSSEVASLFKDRAGTLWIGHNTGELTRYRGGRFEAVQIRPAWKKPMIWHMGSDAKDDLWLMNDEGLLFCVTDGSLLTPLSGGAQAFFSFERDDDGTMWIGRNGVLSVFQGGKLQPQKFDQPSLESSYVQGVCPGSDGGLWVVSNGRLQKWNGQTQTDELGAVPWGMAAITRMIETRGGLLAVGTPDHGLYLIKPHGETECFNRTNGFHDDWIKSLYEDREGNLWVGTGANGLVMLRRSMFKTLDPPDNWKGRAVSSVTTGKAGDLWIGTGGAGLYQCRDGSWTNWGVDSGVANPYVWSALEDVHGNVWIGTSGSGLLVRRGDRFETAPGWENRPLIVSAMSRRADGGLWIGSSAGLLGYKKGRLTWPVTNESNSLEGS